MTDIKLDAFNDIDLSSGGLELISGADETAQHQSTRLRFIRGEWFLDQRIGVPYFEREGVRTPILGVKNPNLAAARIAFARTIRETPGTVSLDSLELLFDPLTRALSVNYSSLLEGDEVARDFSVELIL